MQGYWNQPAETATMLKNRRLFTSDVAVMSEGGVLHIVVRKKDIIMVSSFNAYPNEVEDCRALVLEAGVVGTPDPIAGELVRAYVVRTPKAPGALIEEAIIAHCCCKPLQGAEIGDYPRRAAEIAHRKDPAEGAEGRDASRICGEGLTC